MRIGGLRGTIFVAGVVAGFVLSFALVQPAHAKRKGAKSAPKSEDQLLAGPAVPPPAFASSMPPLQELVNGRPPEHNTRVKHAQELMGPRYRHSILHGVQDETPQEVDAWVHRWVQNSLPKNWRKSSREISKTLIAEARKLGFDPIFLLAVIHTESGFKPDAKGRDGEIGLMQIMPRTAEELAPQAGVTWKGKKTLKNPVMNIKIGAQFLSQLRQKFGSHSQLYLAAYNMGAGNVKEALSNRRMPKQYPKRIMVHYLELYRRVKKG